MNMDPDPESPRAPLHKELYIYNLEGGLFQWANEGREVVDNQGGAIRMVHPYNSFWGKLLNYDLRYRI